MNSGVGEGGGEADQHNKSGVKINANQGRRGTFSRVEFCLRATYLDRDSDNAMANGTNKPKTYEQKVKGEGTPKGERFINDNLVFILEEYHHLNSYSQCMQ